MIVLCGSFCLVESILDSISPGNTVDFISHNGMSVACLHGKIVSNTFKNQTGSPLMDFGPGKIRHIISIIT